MADAGHELRACVEDTHPAPIGLSLIRINPHRIRPPQRGEFRCSIVRLSRKGSVSWQKIFVPRLEKPLELHAKIVGTVGRAHPGVSVDQFLPDELIESVVKGLHAFLYGRRRVHHGADRWQISLT